MPKKTLSIVPKQKGKEEGILLQWKAEMVLS